MSPPLLLIDAGSTRLKWAAVSRAGKIRPGGAMALREITAASIAKLARQFPGHRTILACVVPRLIPFFRAAFGQHVYVVTGRSPALQLPFDYPRPAELGADRLAAAVAAREDGIWPAIVVSCGTAVACTVLDEQGRLCGGAISPGLDAQLAALLGATAQLPATSLRAAQSLPARSTREAIRAGLLLGYQGGVKEIVSRLAESLSGTRAPRILLTGGDAARLGGIFGKTAAAEVRPLLVMEGLRIIGARLFMSRP
jgi:type III pantothenate kinase